MEHKDFVRLCELSMIAAMPEYCVVDTPSLKTRFKKVAKKVEPELVSLPRVTPDDVKKAFSVIAEFEEKLGWLSKPKHPMTIANFCMFLAEELGLSDLTEYLIKEVIGFMDSVPKWKARNRACLMGGKLAHDKWENMKQRLYAGVN